MSRELRVACVAVFAASAVVRGQQVDDPSRLVTSSPNPPRVFGTLQTGIYNIGPDDMAARLQQWDNFALFNNAYAAPAMLNSVLRLNGPIHLDSGVILESAEIFYYDAHPINEPLATFMRASTTGGLESIGANVVFPVSSAGDLSVTFDFPPGTVVDNENYVYGLSIQLNSGGSGEHQRFYRARIHYRRQVSPDPAFSTFNDVLVGHPFHRYVEALAAAGITGGCSGAPPLYCPDAPVTRGQMAVFLSVALGLYFPN